MRFLVLYFPADPVESFLVCIGFSTLVRNSAVAINYLPTYPFPKLVYGNSGISGLLKFILISLDTGNDGGSCTDDDLSGEEEEMPEIIPSIASEYEVCFGRK